MTEVGEWGRSVGYVHHSGVYILQVMVICVHFSYVTIMGVMGWDEVYTLVMKSMALFFYLKKLHFINF